MSTGLAELLTASNEKADQAYSKFLHTAGRLARGEDIPAKALADVCKAAGKTPTELADEVSKNAQPLVGCIDKIEESLSVSEASRLGFEVLGKFTAWIEREQAAIVRSVINLDLLRKQCSSELFQLNTAVARAYEDDARARKALKEKADIYGIPIPAPLPDRPQPPCHQFKLEFPDWRELTWTLFVIEADAVRGKPLPLDVPEKSIHQLFPELMKVQSTVTEPAKVESPSIPAAVEVSDLPSLDDPFSFLGDSK